MKTMYRFIHHCIAHPAMFWAPRSRLVSRLRAWSAAKAWGQPLVADLANDLTEVAKRSKTSVVVLVRNGKNVSVLGSVGSDRIEMATDLYRVGNALFRN